MKHPDYDIVVEATNPDHIASIWRLYGAADVLNELEAAKKEYKGIAGLGMAISICEKMVADGRARMAGESLRAAAKAGYDINTHREIVTTIFEDKPVIMMMEPKLL